MASNSLRAWLRKYRPTTVRITTDDDQERTIKVGPPGRNQWKNVEETIQASGGVRAEALDDKGTILHATPLDTEGGEVDDDETREEKRSDKAMTKTTHANAALISQVAHHMNEAFAHGVSAGQGEREHLLSLVDTLTGHLTAAITNMHEVSMAHAKLIQDAAAAQDNDSSGSTQALMQVLGGVAAAQLKPSTPNGATKKE